MHILFVHPNFPAQFGHIARYLHRRLGWRCTFVSQKPPSRGGEIECVQYTTRGGATKATHVFGRTFENGVWHAHAIYLSLKARPDIQPDLVVGHSGFGTTLFLKELYPHAPVVNYFEYFYRSRNSDIDFRPDFPASDLARLRSRTRNAMILLDLENCDAGYSPTRWQLQLFPEQYRSKLELAFDGIDTGLWRPGDAATRVFNGVTIPDGVQVITYATRGMESMRGFDIFMKAANSISKAKKNVVFVIAGQDRVCYGGDERFTNGATFKEWVLANGSYDLSRFYFVGILPPAQLASLFRLTSVHFYLTVPFVLSWSLFNAMACGAVVLASDTQPVREIVDHMQTGLLVDFFDVDAFATAAIRVLEQPHEFSHISHAASQHIQDSYSMSACMPRLVSIYQNAAKPS